MTEKRWKAQERRIAQALNCVRLKRGGEPGPDLENEMLKVEVKDRTDLPQWILAGLAQARSFATPRQLGLLVITSSSTIQTLVVMDLADYRAWYMETPKVVCGDAPKGQRGEMTRKELFELQQSLARAWTLCSTLWALGHFTSDEEAKVIFTCYLTLNKMCNLVKHYLSQLPLEKEVPK